MTARFEIARLGAQGDGVVDIGGGHLFIPFTLPGEVVTAAREKDRRNCSPYSNRRPSASRLSAAISPNAVVAPSSISRRAPIMPGSGALWFMP